MALRQHHARAGVTEASWARHKEALVPRVGQMVGTLFEKIGSSVFPEKVAGLVRHAFDGLAEDKRTCSVVACRSHHFPTTKLCL